MTKRLRFIVDDLHYLEQLDNHDIQTFQEVCNNLPENAVHRFQNYYLTLCKECNEFFIYTRLNQDAHKKPVFIPENLSFQISYEKDESLPESLNALIRDKINWIRGTHGTGKTTYMRELARIEYYENCSNRFQYYVWVDYDKDLKMSIKKALVGSMVEFDRVKQDDCLLFIDNAGPQVEKELKEYQSYCVITTSAVEGDFAAFLHPNKEKCLRIFCKEIYHYINFEDDQYHNKMEVQNDDGREEKKKTTMEIVKEIVERTAGLSEAAHLLGLQALSYLQNGKQLHTYLDDLEKEGFHLTIDNKTVGKQGVPGNVAKAIANRFYQDFANLSQEERNILCCFCLLGGSNAPVNPWKIEWEKDHYDRFSHLADQGFLNRSDNDCFIMHDIMHAAMETLCGDITYDNVSSLVEALAKGIDRDNLHGSDMMSVYNEVYYAYSLFIYLSGEDYAKKQRRDLAEIEYEPAYAWMVNNLFSAFDDYNDPRAYAGSKYAVMLCEEAHAKKGLSDYQLAVSYNCVGYLPSVYSRLKMDEEIMTYCKENLEYLQKAKDLLNKMEAEGEFHPTLKAKVHSNIGAYWQRLYRFTKDESAISEAIKEHTMAIKMREEQLDAQDTDKDALCVQVARSMYNLATDYFFSGDYENAINQHRAAIDMYKKTNINQKNNLFLSYSRLAHTEYQYAKKTSKLRSLIAAYTDYNKARTYLMELSEANQMGAEDFYKQFLHVACALSRYNLSGPNGKEMIVPLAEEIEKIMRYNNKPESEIVDFLNSYQIWGMDEKYTLE